LTSARAARRLAAFLAADVAGYLRSMARVRGGASARQNAHRSELVGGKVELVINRRTARARAVEVIE
jgi:hypothetical protein